MAFWRFVFHVRSAVAALALMAAQFAGGNQGQGPAPAQSGNHTPPVREGVSDFTEDQLVRVTEMIARALSAAATSDWSGDVRMYAAAYEQYLQTGGVPEADGGQEATTRRSSADPSVGNVNCSERTADNPHKGHNAAWEQVVKAKAFATCATIWWDTRPSAHEVRWRLVMNLRDVSGGAGLVGTAAWRKTGYTAQWFRNSGNGPDNVGTQVFARDCRNGTYENQIAVFLELPWPYYLTRGNPVGADDKTASVTNCPRPLAWGPGGMKAR